MQTRRPAEFVKLIIFCRYNHKWSRMVQDAISTVLLCAWLGGMSTDSRPGEIGRLLTLEEIGETFHGLQPSPMSDPYSSLGG